MITGRYIYSVWRRQGKTWWCWKILYAITETARIWT